MKLNRESRAAAACLTKVRRAIASGEQNFRCESYELALADADRALSVEKDNLAALELKARTLWQLGSLIPLRGTLVKLISINPYEPGYFAMLGGVYQSQEMFTEAVAYLEKSISVSKKPDQATLQLLAQARLCESRAMSRLGALQRVSKQEVKLAEPLYDLSARPS